ncbi:MAG: RCC1 domain-containing protein [Burkholderiales bacterium]
MNVSGASNATSVSAGIYNTCAVLTSGAVQCWGYSITGLLGFGSITNSNIPVSVSGVSNGTSISVGGAHTCVVLASGAVQCWGLNNYGQYGNGITTNSSSPVSVIGANGQGLLNLSGAVPSSLATDADKVFAWAERTYAAVFATSGQVSQTIPGYRVRAYAGGHYLGVNDSGTVHLYYLGPLSNNAILDLGLLSVWVVQAGP